MEILVIDGQGGGLGRQLVAAVKKAVPQAVVTAIGTNSAATSAMLKAGADRAAHIAVVQRFAHIRRWTAYQL